MHKLLIEWKHFEKEGKTCKRCSKTGINIITVIEKLQKEFSSKKICIEFKETKLPENRMAESNSIFIDGIPLENLIYNTKVGSNNCYSCSELIENSANCRCRTMRHGKNIFEEIPTDLIKQAIINMKGHL